MKKILFVDDEPFEIRLYVEALEESGYEVELCDSSDRAIEILGVDNDYSLFVLDIMMPIPDVAKVDDSADFDDTGLWILKYIEGRRGIRVPFVVLTNRNLATVKKSISSLGIDPYMYKVRSKLETPANTLPRYVGEMITTTLS